MLLCAHSCTQFCCTENFVNLCAQLGCAGGIAPGTSASIEIFTADLLIPSSGIQASFTYKLAGHQLTSLELWCWFEPSNGPMHQTPSTQPSGGKSHGVVSGDLQTAAVNSVQAAGNSTGDSNSTACGQSGDSLQPHQDSKLGSQLRTGQQTVALLGRRDAEDAGKDKRQRVLAMLQPQGCVVIGPSQQAQHAVLSQ